MTKRRLTFASTWGATALLLAACSSGSATPNGEGGAAGAAGTDTGALGPNGCTLEPDCKTFDSCQTLEELRAECDHGGEYTLYASRCGGTYVEGTNAETESTWVFDADGNQIGGSYEAEGSCSEWGSTCGPIGPAKPLCSEGGEGGMGAAGDVGGAGSGGATGGAAGAGGSD